MISPKFIMLVLLPLYSLAQTPSPFIHVDQFGYQTQAQKVAFGDLIK